ncbi:nuclease-related domain-containing protein [Gracilibacillus sp. YIM 98692]|uniref:nuclease-related domain-containing protein n=1 Tax=Gracilibacillus sp. YIM 98692 TaxID=2663532 RepID=UPI0013D6C450|nr:nuclease-related domain-containing protein [Gracilibacillus sp. YIM 98692]
MIPAVPLVHRKYEALRNRLPADHMQYSTIDDFCRRYHSGYQGEQSLGYYIDLLADLDIHWLKRLRLKYQHYFQIDLLCVTPSFLLLIESKNITGSIYFDPYAKQLLRQIDDQQKLFSDPLLQVGLQAKQLRQFLSHTDFPSLPIHTISAFTNRNGHLLLQDYKDRDRILTSQELPFYVENLVAKHNVPKLTSSQCAQLTRYLESHHQEADIDILKKHAILWEEIKKGVPCPACSRYRMARIRHRWECPHCNHRSHDAHIPVLTELALLAGNRITNKLAREFLMMESRHAAAKLLIRAGFERVGTGKGAYYILPESEVARKS